MDEKLTILREQFRQDLRGVSTADNLVALRDKYLGRKSGLIAAEKKRIGSLSAGERAEFGRQVNEISTEVEAEIARLNEQFAAEAETRALERERDRVRALESENAQLQKQLRIEKGLREDFEADLARVEPELTELKGKLTGEQGCV